MTPKTTSEALALVPVKPTEAMLRPFYECPPEELELAWTAMLEIAKNQQARAALSPHQPATAGGEQLAGLLFDFGGFLTTHETRWKFSAYDDASPMVEAIEEFAAKRGLSLDDPAISSWHKAPADSAKPAGGPIKEAMSRLMPVFDKLIGGAVFTADKAGQVIADMDVLRRFAAAPAPSPEPVLTDAIEAIITERRASWDGASQRDREIAYLALDDLRSKLRYRARTATNPEPASAPSEGAKPIAQVSEVDGKKCVTFYTHEAMYSTPLWSKLYLAPTSPAVQEGQAKDHEIAAFVNDLRDIGKEFGQTQQLRERISHRVHEFLALAGGKRGWG